jgi:hypothetical protein
MEDYYDHMSVEVAAPVPVDELTVAEGDIIDVIEPSLTTLFDLSDVTPISAAGN